MALTRILLWLGNSFVGCAIVMAITALCGIIVVEYVQALRFGFMTLVTGVIGAIFIATTRNTPAREKNSDALAFLLLFWTLLPLILAVPYLFSGATTSFVTAYFETVSALTTTGASTLFADELPDTLLFWRSLLQWVGGVSAATFAVVVLAALNLSGTGVHRSMLFTLKTGELFERLIGIGRVVAGVYGVLSAFCFVGLVLTGTPIFESICLAMTSVSTGGLTPRDGPLAEYVGPAGSMILAVFCLLGAFSVAALWDVIRRSGWRDQLNLVRNIEHRGLIVIALILVIAGIAFAGPLHIWTLIPEAIFMASGTGFDYQVIGIELLPPTILIATALIGGSALSTTGGVKIIRIYLLFRHLVTDLFRLPHPSRSLPISFQGRIIPDRAFLSIWMYFFGYTIVLSLGIVALGAAGLDLSTAVSTSAASLANMGPLLDASMTGTLYSDFTPSQQFTSSILMLLGRVEILALFAAISSMADRRV